MMLPSFGTSRAVEAVTYLRINSRGMYLYHIAFLHLQFTRWVRYTEFPCKHLEIICLNKDPTCGAQWGAQPSQSI